MYNSTLTSIEFKKVAITQDSSITKLCTGCPRLQELTLDCEGPTDSTATDESTSSIAKYCPDIHALSLVGWNKLTDVSLTPLSALASLRQINLSYCTGLTSAGLQGLLTCNRKLESIILLSELIPANKWEYCNDAFIRCIGECCPLLRALSLDVMLLVTEESLIALVRGCPLLDDLSLRCHKRQISDRILDELSTSCPRLRKVTFYGGKFTGVGLEALTSKCTELASLNLSHNSKLTDEGIVSIAFNCKNLRSLSLDDIEMITDYALSLLFQSCPQLTSVSLTRMHLITDSSILALARYLPGLKTLSLNTNLLLTDRSMIALATLHELTSLSVYSCASLSDDTVRSIARHCRKLGDVNIMGSPLVTEQSLIGLLDFSKRLKFIDLSRCGVKWTPYTKSIHLRKRPSARRTIVKLGVDEVYYLQIYAME